MFPVNLVQLAAIVFGTFVSEDLTCIGTGLLIRQGQVSVPLGVLACFLGIFSSDFALWLAGRCFGRRLFSNERLEPMRAWFTRSGWWALVAARFLPGTRLPLYVAAGAFGPPAAVFAFWSGLAALVWTPLVVLAVALFGEAATQPFTRAFGPGWLALVLAAGLLFVVFRVGVLSSTALGRANLAARVSRLWRWEFWPSWLFYAPLVPWLGWLSLRYRSLTVWTAANPGIPDGGVVGESKFAILSQLPERWVVPTLLVAAGETALRIRHLRRHFEEKGWQFPLILKPDASQRGAGLKLARDWIDVEKYLQRHAAAVLAQTYHPGPYEAGVFYYRLPGEAGGHVFSITDKHFPEVVGDGTSTLEELIWRHPRYRMQAGTFLARHEGERSRVLPPGAPFRLAVAGNHCQGTMFRDGGHLCTPELERTLDTMVCGYEGFLIGRFDVRYRDVDAFMAGRDLAIVELNGATSESTNIYDPDWSLGRAYGVLFRQWRLLYRIGDANRRRGHRPTALPDLVRLVFRYYRHRQIDPLAD